MQFKSKILNEWQDVQKGCCVCVANEDIMTEAQGSDCVMNRNVLWANFSKYKVTRNLCLICRAQPPIRGQAFNRAPNGRTKTSTDAGTRPFSANHASGSPLWYLGRAREPFVERFDCRNDIRLGLVMRSLEGESYSLFVGPLFVF